MHMSNNVDFRALDLVPAQICVLNGLGDIRFVNESWREFARENDYRGNDFSSVNYLNVCKSSAGVEEKAAGSFGARLKLLLQGGEEKKFSTVYPCHAPRQKRWFKAMAQALDDGAVVTHTDITEEYLRLEAESRVLTSAGVIHDLRSPLNAVIGFADLSMALAKDDVSPVIADSLGHIRQAGNRMLTLVNDLLDYAQELHNNNAAEETAVSLASLLTEVIGQVTPSARKRNISLKRIQDREFFLLCDEQATWKLLLNLTSNAVKYNREGGDVALFIDVNPSGGIEICVQDTGVGIPSNQLVEMFAPFSRSDDARVTLPMEGTGIGLALVREIAIRHDGMIRISSAPGVGTSVTVVFPAWRTIR